MNRRVISEKRNEEGRKELRLHLLFTNRADLT